jgi:biotin-dependent carboxylase-like uncharacterized protein
MIKVLKPGIITTIQDQGRIGYANVGVPVSGVMDRYSADIANSILNNSKDAAVLEVTLAGAKFQFLKSTTICISGADLSPTINNRPVLLNCRLSIVEGDILAFGKANYGVRAYIAVVGGIQSELKLQSRSSFKSITKEFYLKKGDVLKIIDKSTSYKSTHTILKVNEKHFNSKELHCFEGPEFHLLSKAQIDILLNSPFTISKENSRMGYKLNETLENNLPSILTSSVLPGTVQLTPSGTLIVLMRDCQVTGGYPRVLQLDEASINRMSQKTTKSVIQFSTISI